MKYIVFDTDIGCDCDDAGALAMLHYYENRGQIKLLAATFCTSSPYGAGSIDAINRYYHRGDIPVGTPKHSGFMDDEKYYYYGPQLCSEYDTQYPTGDLAPDCVPIFRQALVDAPGKVTVVATGPVHNLPAFLQSPPDDISSLSGRELIAQKVEELVVMGGYFPENQRVVFPDGNEMGAEFNIVCDIPAAQYVSHHWPTPIVYTGFEIGYFIQTGQKLLDTQTNSNPVRRSYELFCNSNRHSWDQTAVLYAVEGAHPYWTKSPAGHILFDDAGNSRLLESTEKRHSYLQPLAPPQQIAGLIETMMLEKPINVLGR